MSYTIWSSTSDIAAFIRMHTLLNGREVKFRKLDESDAAKPRSFHKIPDHLKKILYLDCPDIIIERDGRPIVSIEISTEAGTGHNAFQRFARLAASVEANVPAIYIYPQATLVERNTPRYSIRWDKINLLIIKALEKIMQVYGIPALLFYYPTDFKKFENNPGDAPSRLTKGLKRDTISSCPDPRTPEMETFFEVINDILFNSEKFGVIESREKNLRLSSVLRHRDFMQRELYRDGCEHFNSPLTSTVKVPTEAVVKFIKNLTSSIADAGELILGRPESVIYKVNARFRGDPYPGALAAIDYLLCRYGKTFEEREYNLILGWGNVVFHPETCTLTIDKRNSEIKAFTDAVNASERNNLLRRNFRQLDVNQIPRYYMQVRYGSAYSKAKHIRIYSYFSDAILFSDGCLWRQG